MDNLDLQQPLPGYWYINRTGKLMKVKMVMLGHEGIESILLEYIEGATQTISIEDWQCLDLVIPRHEQGEILLETDNAF